jgi:hypothetical protein
MRIKRTLEQVGERLIKAREDLRIIEEQILFQMDVVQEAQTRAVVSETPLADREHEEARRDYERMQRQRKEAEAEIAELQAEQDRLLDRMLGQA